MNNSPSLLDQARKLHHDGRSEDALLLLDQARRTHPRQVELYAIMADIFEALGQNNAAEQVLQAAHMIAPDDVIITNQLANYFYRNNQPAAGLALTKPKIAKSCPIALMVTHANLCKLAGETEEARKFYEKILQAEPKNIYALSNLGNLHLDNQEYEKAITLLKKALGHDPGNAHISVQLAHASFRAGDVSAGWDYYDARFGSGVIARSFPQKNWTGGSIEGTLLLWGEQGIGEHILYASMLEDAKRDVASILVECEPRLLPLFARSFSGVRFVAKSDPPDLLCLKSDITHQAPLGQLGKIYRRTFSDFASRKNYLMADEAKTKLLRARYEDVKKRKKLTGKIIGISWASKPLRHGDPKSSELSAWKEILQDSPHLFIDLQYGDTAADLSRAQGLGWPLHHDAQINQQNSLDDFAAQIAALDEVISVSNTTAHMAGALGIKTAVLLPKSKGLMWHWFDHRTDSPWYPSVTLIRQHEDGNWKHALQEAARFINP